MFHFVQQPSTFHVECVCGAAIITTTRETQCKACGRLAEIRWPADIADERKDEPYDTRWPAERRAA